MNKPGRSDSEKDPARTGDIHSAFSAETKEKVDELTAKLVRDGYEMVSGPRAAGDGFDQRCVAEIKRNQIEITI